MINKIIIIIILFIGLVSCDPNIVEYNNTVRAKELPKYKHSIDSIYVSKGKKIMTLYSKKKRIKAYRISIGRNTSGHKQYEGDNRTPEGKYYITERNPNSDYFLNLHISYPNNKDRASAKALGKSPGGSVKIHGYANYNKSTKYMNVKFRSTQGCIAVTNNNMKEIYSLVKTNAVILIQP